MYVSRRLRVFDDKTLAPLVLADKLTVSAAEELLVVTDVQRRAELAQQAAEQRWERPKVRAAVRCRVAAIQQPSPRLTSHIRALTDGLASIDPLALSKRVLNYHSRPDRPRVVPHRPSRG
jgi:hypothetical protein